MNPASTALFVCLGEYIVADLYHVLGEFNAYLDIALQSQNIAFVVNQSLKRNPPSPYSAMWIFPS